MAQKIKSSSLSIHLRLQIGEKIALGPGKMELLRQLDETASISEAARRMKMSYMKAWSLTQSMKPLIKPARGGENGGGAQLTKMGRETLALYQKMERDSRRAAETSWKKLQRLLQGHESNSFLKRKKIMRPPAVIFDRI